MKPNTRGIDKNSTDKSHTKILENVSEFGYKCDCLNARTLVNRRNELNIMVEDIDPHIIGVSEPLPPPPIYQMEN